MQPTVIENPDVSSDRLAHGFKRTLFGFPPSFRRNSSQDKYGYLFATKSQSATIAFSDANRQLLENLGRNMIDIVGSDDAPGFSTIDAGYTYFGQFVDHDLTFDIDSSTKKVQDARELINYRTPNLDLDSVYGDGPAVDVFMYDAQGLRFVLGNSNQFDLPRSTAGLGIIGDPRNDENLIVAQLHMSMLRFHNAVIDQLQQENQSAKNDELFRLAQREVRRHYQWVVFHDYLRTIVGAELIEDVMTNGLKIFSPKKHPRFFMPVEFSAAAYRFGHSQIRDRYHFNSTFSNQEFLNAFSFTKTPVPTSWNVHWPSFFGTENQPAANKARKIDTRVAMSMGNLPSAPGAPPNSIFSILSARNLIRGMALKVPTSQYVAKRMNVSLLTHDQLLSSPYQNPTPEQEAQHQTTVQTLQSENSQLLRNTPLWYYILKEAEVLHGGNQLGPVGGRIVAEVFMRLLMENEDSFLNSNTWKPRFGAQGADASNYKIIDLLRFAGTYPTPGIS
jgi:hypothetical protein